MSSRNIEFHIPKNVLKICTILSENDEDGYLVGGSLRDLILGNVPDDWDLATTATPDKMMRLFRRVIPTGIAHGTVTVLMGGETFEMTTLRSEFGYSDGRHPDSVKFVTSIVEDLSRRDFTVNAIAWNPLTREMFDPFGGESDLHARRLVAVGDAQKRFNEDGLRIMRAARFAATLKFELAESTAEAIGQTAYRLENVSVERKRDEFQKLLLAAKPSPGLRILLQNNVFRYLCPGVERCETEQDWEQIFRLVDAVPAQVHLRLTALWYGVDASLVTSWLERFLIDKRIRKQVQHLIAFFPFHLEKDCSDTTFRTTLSDIGKSFVPDFLALLNAHIEAGTGTMGSGEWVEGRLQQMNLAACPLSIAELDVNGGDLTTRLGIAPGPSIGKILRFLLAHVIAHPQDNEKVRLLEIVRKNYL